MEGLKDQGSGSGGQGPEGPSNAADSPVIIQVVREGCQQQEVHISSKSLEATTPLKSKSPTVKFSALSIAESNSNYDEGSDLDVQDPAAGLENNEDSSNNDNNNNNESDIGTTGSDDDEEPCTEDSDPEEWNSSDLSETEGSKTEVIMDHESIFLALLDQRISDTEKIFDNSNFILHCVPPINVSTQISSDQFQAAKSTSGPKSEGLKKVMVDKDTQVDSEDDAKLKGRGEISPPGDGTKSGVDEVQKAREEIVHLRTVRDSLSSQAQVLVKKIKSSRDPDSTDETKLFEFEEAIAAIDACIEFKNEIICGREYIFSNNLAPGMNETNLATRLTSLTTLDLQRLLSTMFTKVVEFRHSTKRMEKQIQKIESKYEQTNRRLARLDRQTKQLQEEHESAIEDIIRYFRKDPGTPLAEYLRHSKAAKDSRQRQDDLELSLTELLVRHNYLDGNEAKNYELKHVMKMLKIDPLKLKLYQMEEEEERKKSSMPVGLRLHLGNQIPESQGLSRRMREAYGQRRHHHRSSGAGHLDSRSHAYTNGPGHGLPTSSSHLRHHRNHQTNGDVTNDHHPSSSKYKHKS